MNECKVSVNGCRATMTYRKLIIILLQKVIKIYLKKYINKYDKQFKTESNKYDIVVVNKELLR